MLFSPTLLSCAAVIWQSLKTRTFETVPDWTSVSNTNPRIKTYPRCQNMFDYHPPTNDSPGNESGSVTQEDNMIAIDHFETATPAV
jgi:hypothetical protein